jgi:hypothetical protein
VACFTWEDLACDIMGFGQNLLVFAFLGAVLLSLAGYGNSSSNSAVNTISSYVGVNTTTGQPSQSGTLQTSFWLLLGVGAGAILLGAIFPNPYVIFAGIAMGLLSLVSVYYSMFQETGMPVIFQVVFGGALAVLMLLTTVGFLKGGEW